MIPAQNPLRYYTFLGAGQQPPLDDCRCHVVVDDRGLRLATKPDGPLSLTSTDGSLGRLLLPRGFAIDSRLRCYFVDEDANWLRAFDPAQLPQSSDAPFRKALHLPCPRARRGRNAWSLAVTSRLLLVVNPHDGALLGYRFGDWNLAEVECFPGGAIDVAALGDAVYCLTPRALYVRREHGAPWRTVRLPSELRSDARVVVDRQGRLYLVMHEPAGSTSASQLSWSHRAGSVEGALRPASIVRTSLPFPSVYAVTGGRESDGRWFVIPPELTSPCDRRLLKPAERAPWEIAHPPITREMLDAADLRYGFVVAEAGGRRIRSDEFEPRTAAAFLRGEVPSQSGGRPQEKAFWISPPIDSALYECRWDLVEIECNPLPPGSGIAVSTCTFDPVEFDQHPHQPPSDCLWTAGITIRPSTATESPPGRHDFLVRSRRGQFLCLRIELLGDGHTTPVVSQVTARAPRQSYVDFLPAVMREDDASRDFLERFLAVFQAEWDGLEETLAEMHHTFDPEHVRCDRLDWLASWFGVEVPRIGRDIDRRRALGNVLRAGTQPPRPISRGDGTTQLTGGGTRRGTARHLHQHLAAVLAGLAELKPEELRGFPWIIEGFRERACLTVGGQRPLGDGAPNEPRLAGDQLAPGSGHFLWGHDATGRLQLGVDSLLGRQKLMPPVRPEIELYRAFAHRFRVVAPACWLSSPEAVASFRSAIEREKPAHTAYELTLIGPCFQIGFKSTVGIDTIIGPFPPDFVLSRAAAPLGLGQGSILAPAVSARPLRLGDRLGTVEL